MPSHHNITFGPVRMRSDGYYEVSARMPDGKVIVARSSRQAFKPGIDREARESQASARAQNNPGSLRKDAEDQLAMAIERWESEHAK